VTAGQWELIKRIFNSAVNLDPAQWPEYVRSVTESEDIRETVLDLLRNHQQIGSVSARPVPARGPALLPGECIAGRFRVVRFIASGGMGEVYEVFDENLNVRLALKTLRSDRATDSEALPRFRREVILPRGVSHDNVCRVYDLIEHTIQDGAFGNRVIPCLSMELLEGENLSEFLSRERPLSPARAMPIIRQMANGLAALHQQGIIHRDLKPSNIMLVRRKDGTQRAVLMDFGLARTETHDTEVFESRSDFRAGAPYFMAPEILRDSKPSIASDIYAFGLVIDEMVTRTRAFAGTSLQALYFAKLWEEPLNPVDRAPDLREHWGLTILKCLDRDPAMRFESVPRIIAALDDWSSVAIRPAPLPLSSEPLSHPALPAGAAVPRRFLTRRRLIASAAGAPVLVGAAAVAAIAFQPVDTSVEVFNIDNLTGRDSYDYLCRGTTSELMRRLTHISGVRVIPVYATHSKAPAQRTGRFSLDGMLQAQGDTVRLSIQIVDNRASSLVWSENFESAKLGNSLQLQGDIARSAAGVLEDRVLMASAASGPATAFVAPLASRVRSFFNLEAAAALPGPPTYSRAAFDYYMQGHNLLEESSPSGTQASIELFTRAVGEDPNFALAYAALADAHLALMNYEVAPRRALADAAKNYAERAVSRDSGLAEAHMVLGAVRQHNWEWKASEDSYREALRLKPRLARARRWFGGMIVSLRRFDEAFAEIGRSMSDDPYDRGAGASLGYLLFQAGRFTESAKVLETAIAARETALARWNLAFTYAWMGYLNKAASAAYFAKAEEQVRRAEALTTPDPGPTHLSPISDYLLAHLNSTRGDPAAADPHLRRIEADMKAGTLSPVVVANVYAAQGRNAEAVQLLRLAAGWRDRRLLYVNINPHFETLHGDSGFQELLRRMNLV